MKPPLPDIQPRWEVLSASHTATTSIYLLSHTETNAGVKVAVSDSNRRVYTWGNYARTKERVPDDVRAEIDRALVRYLSAKK